MDISRRGFLKGATATTAMGGGLLQGCSEHADDVFMHGVASGDPLQTQVILWTRISLPKRALRQQNGRITVVWEVAYDAAFTQPVKHGRTHTTAAVDFTVKVDVSGLSPYTHYFYRFKVGQVISPVGRTKTLPDGDIEQLNIAFTSCSHYMHGYFNVYARIADIDDLDAVLHLGDYIYEYSNSHIYRNPFLLDRRHEPAHETVTLSDYRTRHAQYKRDKDLRRLHATHAMICVWDDHEITNNTWSGGALNHDADEGDWDTRAAAAVRAYYEWMPIREPEFHSHRDSRRQSYRRFRFGSLADLNMLDTRLVGRDEQLSFDQNYQALERTMLGAKQERWLEANLAQAQKEGVVWKLLGQQVQMMQLKVFGRFVNADSWDGYPAARNRLLDAAERIGLDNLVILTGDIHSSWAAEVCKDPYDATRYDPLTAKGAQAVELVSPSVTSPSIPVPGIQQLAGDVAKVVTLDNPHIKYVDIKSRGFIKLTITREHLIADWLHVPVVGFRNSGLFCDRSFKVVSKQSKLHEHAHCPSLKKTARRAPLFTS